jgi:hypothetical protein
MDVLRSAVVLIREALTDAQKQLKEGPTLIVLDDFGAAGAGIAVARSRAGLAELPAVGLGGIVKPRCCNE